MSKTIDNRVVEMRFDNKQFESNVATSMSTLDKLKQKLNLSDASKGLDNIGRAAGKVDMTGLSSGIETVHAKFSALQVVGVTALANIANQAVNTGQKMISALTIDPITTGFNEYETKINSIQTIMSNTASKGTTMADVTKVIDELNTYADKTIYNFAEMTRNIGTFTAAGVELEPAAAAIKGIANLAAASGSSSQQASTAMYQLSQALATGTVKLMDWNSVVNAGMGGEKFQEALKATAREHGVAIDSIIDANGSFRDSLQEGWLSADILNETLNNFTVDGAAKYAKSMMESGKWTQEQADALMEEARAMEDAATKVRTFTQLWDTMKESAQSGWGKTWELVIGDFEKARERLSDLSTMFGSAIGRSADGRNNLLEGALSSKWDILTRKLNAAGIETDAFQTKIREMAENHNVDLDTMIEKEGSFEKALLKAFKDGTLDRSILKDALKSFVGGITGATEATDKAAGSIEKYGEIVNKVISGDFGSGKERMDALTNAGYDYATVQNLVNDKLGSSIRHLSSLSNEQVKNADNTSKLSDEQLKNKGYTEEQIVALRDLTKAANESGSSIDDLINNFDKPSGAELIWDSFFTVLKTVGSAIQAVSAAWVDIFPPTTSAQLYGVIESLHSLIQNFKLTKDQTDKITRTFKGLFAIIDIITTIVGGGLKLGFTLVSKILGAFGTDILSVTANVGDAVYAFRNWFLETNAIAKGIDWLIGKLPGAITMVKEWVNSFLNLPHVQSAIENLKNSFEGMKEIGRNVIDGFKNGLKDGLTSIPNMLIQIGRNLLVAIKGVLGIHSPSTEMTEVGENTIQGFLNGLKNSASGVWQFVKELGSKIIATFNDLDWSKLFAAGASVAMFMIVKKLIGIFEAIASPLEGFGDLMGGVGEVLEKSARQIKNVVKNFAKVLKGFSNVLNGFAFNMKAEAIKKIAIALAILVGAIVVLTLIDPKKLWNAVGVVAALATILAGLVILVDRIAQSSAALGTEAIKLTGLSAVLIGIGIAVILLGATVKMIGSLDPDQALRGFLGLAGIIVAIGAVLLAFGGVAKMAGTNTLAISSLGGMLLKMSVAMLLMVLVVKLASKLTVDEMTKGAVAMVGFTVFVTALALAAKIAGANAIAISGLGGMLLKMSIAMLLMIAVVKLSSKLTEDELKKGAVAMVGFAVFVASMVGISRIAGSGEIAKIGGMLLSMSTSMLILAGVAKILGGMEVGEMIKAGVGIAAFTAVMYAMVTMVRTIGPDAPKIAGTLIAMSIAIGILAGVALVLSLISIPGLTKGIIAVGMLGGVMTAMIWATRGANDVKGNLIVMSIAIAVMAASVATLSMIDGTKLAGATIAISTLMGMFALIAKFSGSMGKSMGSLIVITTAIGLLGGVVYMLAKLNIESVFGVSLSLSTLLLSMAASMLLISKTGLVAPTALMALGTMTLIVGGLALIIGLLAKSNPEGVLEIASSMSLLLISMSAACAILSMVGATGGAAFVGIGALITLITAMGGLMVGIGALSEHFPGMEELLNKGIPILEKIGYGLGSFFGNIIGGFSAGVTSGLPTIAENLSAFMINLQPFIDGARNIDETALSGVTSLAKMMALIAGANILESISKWITDSSSMETFSTGIDSFADAIVSFSDKVKGKIDETSVTAAANAGLMMAKMQTLIQGSGGVVQWFSGEKNLTVFGTQLVVFGQAMVAFSNEVKGKIDEGAITAAANAGTLMAELQSKVQPSGGVVQWFAGEKNFAVFGTQLVSFGMAIAAFSKSVSDEGSINESAITAAANAGTIMSTMQSKLVGTDGVLQFFTGEKNMAVFGTQMVAFGQAVVDFSNRVSSDGGVNEQAITAAANAGTLITTLQSSIDPIGRIVDFFTGKKDLAVFGTQMVAFGQAVVDFSNKVKDNIDEDSVSAAANAGRIMASLQKAIPEKKAFDGKVTLDDFGSDISIFGGYLAAYAKKVSEIDTGAIESSTKAAERLLELARNLVGLDTTGIKNFKVSEIGEAIKSYADKVIGIDAGVVSSSVASALKLMNLIRDTAGLDASGVSNFKVEAIGKGMSSYANSVADMNVGTVLLSISAINKLVSLIGNMAGLDASGVSQFVSAINNLGKVSLDGIVKSFSGASARLSMLGSQMINSLSTGMSSKQALVVSTATSIMSSAQTTITSKTTIFKTSGVAIMTNLIAGITSQNSKLASSLTSTIQSTATSIRGHYSTFSNAGGYLATGFANGIQLKAHLAKAAATSMAKASAKAIDDALDINSPSKVTEGSGEWFGEGYSKGITNSTENVVASSKELGKASNESLIETLSEGTADIIQAQGGVDAALLELSKNTQATSTAIREKDLVLEKAYWGNLLTARQNGVDAAKYKTMDITKFEEEILSESISIWDNYLSEIDSKSDSIMNQRDLFDALPEKDDVSKYTLSGNLASQVREYEKFATTIADLNARIKDEDLKKFINTLGVSSLSELEAINSMTDTELTSYASLYQQKFSLAKTSALTQLDGLKTETESKLSNLLGGVNVDATSFGTTFDGTMDSLNGYIRAALDQPEESNNIGRNIAGGVATGIVTAIPVATTAASDMIASVLAATKQAADINSPSKLFETEIGERLAEGIAVGMTGMLSEIAKILTTMIESSITKFGDSYVQFVTIGAYVADGFKEGILSKADDIAEAAAAIARAAMDAVEEELDINSPSKKMFALGGFTGLGFVNGLKAYSTRTYQAGTDVANSARKGISNAIDKVYNIVNGDMTIQPTIRPVLDMSSVEAGAGSISKLLSNRYDLGLSANLNAISSMDTNQNGGIHDVVSAINKLRKDLSGIESNVYSVNGVTYDDGSNIKDAVQSLVRATKVGRRT